MSKNAKIQESKPFRPVVSFLDSERLGEFFDQMERSRSPIKVIERSERHGWKIYRFRGPLYQNALFLVVKPGNLGYICGTQSEAHTCVRNESRA